MVKDLNQIPVVVTARRFDNPKSYQSVATIAKSIGSADSSAPSATADEVKLIKEAGVYRDMSGSALRAIHEREIRTCNNCH